MIHFRYFDTNYDHNGLWEDLIDAFPDLFASAAAIEDLPCFLEVLEKGELEGIVVLIFHFNEHRPGGGYYHLDISQIARWQTPTQVLYVTGGEIERVQRHITHCDLPPCVAVYPHPLSLIHQWTEAQLQHWRTLFETWSSTAPKRYMPPQTTSKAGNSPLQRSASESPLHPIK